MLLRVNNTYILRITFLYLMSQWMTFTLSTLSCHTFKQDLFFSLTQFYLFRELLVQSFNNSFINSNINQKEAT